MVIQGQVEPNKVVPNTDIQTELINKARNIQKEQVAVFIEQNINRQNNLVDTLA